jgi:hypothetical protein
MGRGNWRDKVHEIDINPLNLPKKIKPTCLIAYFRKNKPFNLRRESRKREYDLNNESSSSATW